MGSISKFTNGLLIVSMLAGTVHAQFATTAAQLGATYNPGTIPIGIPAVSVTAYGVTGYHFNPSVYTANATGSSMGAAAGLNPDFHWLGDDGLTAAAGTIWSFSSFTDEYFVYPAIDHDPIPVEALEASIWGSNDGGSTWMLGTIQEVYELGWDPVGIVDNGAQRWSFTVPVDLVAGVVGVTQGTYTYNDGDFEFDAVMQVPEPVTMALMAPFALAVLRRRPRQGRSTRSRHDPGT